MKAEDLDKINWDEVQADLNERIRDLKDRPKVPIRMTIREYIQYAIDNIDKSSLGSTFCHLQAINSIEGKLPVSNGERVYSPENGLIAWYYNEEHMYFFSMTPFKLNLEYNKLGMTPQESILIDSNFIEYKKQEIRNIDFSNIDLEFTCYYKKYKIKRIKSSTSDDRSLFFEGLKIESTKLLGLDKLDITTNKEWDRDKINITLKHLLSLLDDYEKTQL